VILTADMLADLRRVVASEHIGGAAPLDYAQYRRFAALQRRKLIKYFDYRHPRWDRTFYLPTERGCKAV
jgi:hypothetical protein